MMRRFQKRLGNNQNVALSEILLSSEITLCFKTRDCNSLLNLKMFQYQSDLFPLRQKSEPAFRNVAREWRVVFRDLDFFRKMQRIKFSFLLHFLLFQASIFYCRKGIRSVRIKSGSCPAASHQTCRRVDFSFISVKPIDSNDQRLFKSLKRTFKCNKGRKIFKTIDSRAFYLLRWLLFGVFVPPKKLSAFKTWVYFKISCMFDQGSFWGKIF